MQCINKKTKKIGEKQTWDYVPSYRNNTEKKPLHSGESCNEGNLSFLYRAIIKSSGYNEGKHSFLCRVMEIIKQSGIY